MGRLTFELSVAGRRALVVGAGAEVVAKVARLVGAGAEVHVVAREPDAEIVELAESGALRLDRRDPDDGDLDGVLVVFVAASETATGSRLFEWATREGRLVCVIDRPESSTFTNVAVVEVSGLRVTVGTAGASPGLARRAREDLAQLLSDPRLERFVAALGDARERLPRGRRARAMSAAVQGFAIDGALRFPAWFERGDPPPDDEPT